MVEFLNFWCLEYDCDVGIWDFEMVGDSFEFDNVCYCFGYE